MNFLCRYDPKKGNNAVDSDNKSKAQKRKDICLSMLDPDILDRDPKVRNSFHIFLFL